MTTDALRPAFTSAKPPPAVPGTIRGRRDRGWSSALERLSARAKTGARCVIPDPAPGSRWSRAVHVGGSPVSGARRTAAAGLPCLFDQFARMTIEGLDSERDTTLLRRVPIVALDTARSGTAR
jgi:hypothetical protein